MTPSLERTYPFGPRLTIERYRLDNGLTLLFCEDRSAPVFSYQTWFAVGSRQEREGKTGLAHLLEHLMFNETQSLPHGEFDRRIEQAGAESNAATYLDWTFYMVNAPAEAFELVVDLESDRMQNLLLRDELVASEREVVKNERLQCVDDDVDGVIAETLFRTAFERHGYGRPTIGWMEDIEGLTADDCREFYAAYYAPNNATLVVVGDVERTRLLECVARRYGAMARSALPSYAPEAVPRQELERRVELVQPTPTPKLALGYKCPAMSHTDHAPLVVLGEILWGGRSSRGYRKLVHGLEIATEFGGTVGQFCEPSLLELSATARDGVEAERVLVELDALVDELRRDAPTPSEIERAKARIELSTYQGMQSSAGKAEQIGFSEVVLGDPASLWTRLDEYLRVTGEDLVRVAQQYLVSSERSVVVVTPDDDDELDDSEDAA